METPHPSPSTHNAAEAPRLSVTAPQGFRAAATAAGIKPSGKSDMALVVNDGPNDAAAAVFTRNRVKASPVKLSQAALADGALRVVLYNSGNANACNGAQGDADARESQALAAAALGAAVVAAPVSVLYAVGAAPAATAPATPGPASGRAGPPGGRRPPGGGGGPRGGGRAKNA